MDKGHFSIKHYYMLLISKTIFQGLQLPGTRSSGGSPGVHQNREGTGSQSPSHCSSQGLRQPGTAGAAPALGIAHLHGDKLRPGWSVSPAYRWGSGSGPMRGWPGRAMGMGMSQG